MNKIRLKNNKIRIFILVFIIIIFVYIYFLVLTNTNIVINITNDINDRFDKFSINIKDELLYNSLIKVISIDVYNSINYVSKNIIIDTEIEDIVKDPIVYIYNTHDTEKYTSKFISDYSITPSVKLASLILKDYLNDLGIESYVQTKSISSYLNKHNLSYKGAYDASRYYMKNELSKHDYKILIDIHRDSVKRKFTLCKINGEEYAKVMFVLTTKHKNYKKNEKFASYLNDYLNKHYKGLSRGIMKRSDVIFNQDLSDNAILIELGGVDNTLEELNNTLKVLSYALNSYIKENKL